MKIAIIGTTTQTVLAFRSDLIKELVRRGHDVYMLALDYDEQSKNNVRDLGAHPIDYVFSRTGMNPFVDAKNTIKLRNILKEIGPKLVLSYFAKPIVFGTIAAVLAKVPKRVGMFEGLGYAFTELKERAGLKKRLLKKIQVLLYRITLPLLSNVIFLNVDDYKDLIMAYKLKIKNHIILGGIGLNLANYSYTPPNLSSITFLFIGRLLAEKGIHEFIGAAKILQRKYKNVEFVVLGGLDLDNPSALSKEELNKLVSEKIVTYPGFVNNVNSYIAASSVFVLPSYREGFPRSTQEAMVMGRAIITTDVAGCRETVENGSNGFLVKPWDHEDLAEKMSYLVENPEIIERMGQESRKIAVEKFDSHKINNTLINYLKL